MDSLENMHNNFINVYQGQFSGSVNPNSNIFHLLNSVNGLTRNHIGNVRNNNTLIGQFNNFIYNSGNIVNLNVLSSNNFNNTF